MVADCPAKGKEMRAGPAQWHLTVSQGNMFVGKFGGNA
jgi:hypothetical protein